MENIIRQLSDTVDLMLSDNLNDQLLSELIQLGIRIENLVNTINEAKARNLTDTKSNVLEAQLAVMHAYFELLFIRVKEAGIEIDNVIETNKDESSIHKK